MTTLSVSQMQQYAASAGFRGDAQAIIVAIAQAESSGRTDATHTNTDGSIDRGILQINSVAHPEVSDACAFNALCAFQQGYKISNQGTYFQPWTTYNTGAYKQYYSGVPTNVATASSNPFPRGQCTWYADDRYHQLTGYYIPWSGNAADWAANAQHYKGWTVSNKPTVPSIIVLQPGVQEASSQFGHVGVVESIKSDGSIITTDQNWAGITYPNTATVTFHAGNGVAFITAVGTGAITPGFSNPSSPGISSQLFSFIPTATNIVKLSPTDDVTAVLVALDTIMKITNPLDVPNPPQDSALGVTFTDPIAYIIDVSRNVANDISAMFLDAVFMLTGVYICWKVFSQVINLAGTTEKAGSAIKTAASIAALAG